ncbi:MAG TPA: pyridoxal phosphate-dependent aminotransferase [Thermoanaerobaculia bacterium]
MVRASSRYMVWAKNRPAPAIDLAGSNLLACTLDDLPEAREAVDLAGEGSPPDGYPPLVEAIASRYGVLSENVATAVGCSGANFLALAALLEAGDEVLFEQPAYEPLGAAATMLGARVTRFERRFEEGWRLDLDRIGRALTPRTRVVMLSNPHNPSGVLAGEAELQEVARLAERRGATVLVDEVYLDLAGGRPAATLSPFFVSTSSLTKAYGLASLRCGWALGSREITEKIRRARDVVDVWGPIPADRISVVAFRGLDRLAARARRLRGANALLVASFLAGRGELECIASHTTIAFPRFRDGRDSTKFADRLFAEHGVAVVPGDFFDSPSHFRISFSGATDVLEKGLAAIAAFLDA